MVEITNQDEFRTWLGDKPGEVGVAIATRAALRAIPALPSIRGALSEKERRNLLLPAFRSNSTALLAAAGPHDTKTFQEISSTLTFFALEVEPSSSAAGSSAYNAASAAASAAASSDAATFAAFAAKFAAEAAQAAGAGTEMWTSLSLECEALKAATQATTKAANWFDVLRLLIREPLWPSTEVTIPSDTARSTTPEWASDGWNSLKSQLQAVEGEDWQVWTDWYQARLDGAPIDLALEEKRVLIPEHLWDEGPAAVNAAIRRVIEEHRRQQEQASPGQAGRGQGLSAGAMERLRVRLSQDRTAVLLSCGSILEQIAEYRERVRGDNRMDPEARDRLLAFLDRLAGDVEGLAGSVAEADETPTDSEVEQVASWRDRFASALRTEIEAYLGPEALAKAAVPAGLILTCGTLGAMLGGSLGFGAGSYFGQILVGHMKPGAAADRVRKEIEAQGTEPDAP